MEEDSTAAVEEYNEDFYNNSDFVYFYNPDKSVSRVHKSVYEARHSEILSTLEENNWTSWAGRCCVKCSDFPSRELKNLLEEFDNLCLLLTKNRWRNYL